MPMYIVLKDYLTRLSTLESKVPEEKRRQVPNITELADALGIHRVTLSNLANNKLKSLDLDLGAKIICEMRQRGFPMMESDLIIYRD